MYKDMFNAKKFFYQNQHLLLELANKEAGRYLLGIKNNLRVVKLTPNSYHLDAGYGRVVATFYTNNQISKVFSPIITKMQIAESYEYPAFLHYAELERSNYPAVYLATFGPQDADTGCGTTSKSDAAWANTRTNNADSAVDEAYTSYWSNFSGGVYRCDRSHSPFNTSSIGANSSIDSGTNKIEMYRDDTLSPFVNVDSVTVHVLRGQQASGTALAVTDHAPVDYTSGGSLAASSLTNQVYTAINLNSTALTWVDGAGYTKLIVTTDKDQANSAPSGSNTCVFQSTNSANPPRLTLTYTPVMAAFLTNFI